MTGMEFEALITQLEQEALVLSRRKSADYATADKLSNFKRMAAMISPLLRTTVRPSQMAAILLCLKIDRLQNLDDRKPQNEGVWDTYLDAINYVRLTIACDHEERCSRPEAS